MRAGHILVAGMIGASAAWAWAQEAVRTGPGTSPERTPGRETASTARPAEEYVSRKEYEALKKEFEELKAKLEALEKRSETKAETEQSLEYLQQQTQAAQTQAQAAQPGTTKFLLTGDGGMTFSDAENSDSTFSAGYGPLLLWELNKSVLFEAGLDFSLSNDPCGENPGTDVAFSLGNVSYLLNDYLAVGAGKFPVQFGIYHDHLDPRWINRLIDDPLPFSDGISPDTAVGVFATGAAPLGPTRINYSAYVTNGPVLVFDDPLAAGSLDFDNFTDSNNNKAVGGRIGILPIPEVEVGYSIQGARVNPDCFDTTVHALLQGVDFNFVRDVDWLKGRVVARAEWIWADVGRALYDPTGAIGFGPLNFNNDRNGGYYQLSYRPTKVASDVLKKCELVIRYAELNASEHAPGGGRRSRWTPGVDFWINASTVTKAAYEFSHGDNGDDENAFLFQFAVGF